MNKFERREFLFSRDFITFGTGKAMKKSMKKN